MDAIIFPNESILSCCLGNDLRLKCCLLDAIDLLPTTSSLMHHQEEAA